MFFFRKKSDRAKTDRVLRDPPKISVITPSYNQGGVLEQCIRSVLEQNYPRLEYIVVDGGSSDESLSIIKKYERHITQWISEPDDGQSDAINKGFRSASGDLVAWLNSDDYYLPGALVTVAEAWRRSPGAPFYFGDGWRVSEAGEQISGFVPDGQVCFDRAALIFGLNYILQPATFIDRGHLMQIGYLDQSLRYGMDTDLWIRLSAQGAPFAISSRLAASREYENTKTATGSFERIEELRRIAEKYSGATMTPGVLLYFLHTLRGLCSQREDVFPSVFLGHIDGFSSQASKLLAKYGAGCDGFPVAQVGSAHEARPPIKPS